MTALLITAQILETLLVNVVYQPPLWAEVYSIHFIVLSQGDVLKVDFGIHVRGRILDSAFTLTWDHTYDKLLEAVRDATNTGIRVGFEPLSMLCDAELAVDHTGSWYRCPPGRVSWANSRKHRIIRGGGGWENDSGCDSKTSYARRMTTADHRFGRIPSEAN